MASAAHKPLGGATPVTLGERSIAACALLAGTVLLYGALGLAGIVPLPASVGSLARAQQIGHTKVMVAGYYVTQPFIALGGVQLPPYVFAAGTNKDAPAVHVAPALPDVKAGKNAAVIDTATGDGSEASPFAIHTIARWDSFVSAIIVGALIAVAFAFWLAGTVV
ncbi:MAG TPA: hypothetical protein VGQ96_05520, partial [Candidatus Eremiobacteraceae bacterium]|nr:hypothetical protein [Candidatus Eremiobacteraceae bacterium]